MNKYKFDQFHFLKKFKNNKAIGLAFNYKSMVKKKNNYDEPLIFLKSNTSLIRNKESIIYPSGFKKVWIEAELCIIIGKTCKNIESKKSKDYILGYTCGNDVTAENIFNRDWHLARSKGLDTFAPIGPSLITDIKTDNLKIKSYINGKKTQDSNTNERILNDAECVELVSKFITLYPGDIIFTGTPAGALEAIIKPGDEVIIEIEKLGKLTNKVI